MESRIEGAFADEAELVWRSNFIIYSTLERIKKKEIIPQTFLLYTTLTAITPEIDKYLFNPNITHQTNSITRSYGILSTI